MLGCGANIPVMPAMIAADNNLLTAVKSTGKTYCCGSGMKPFFPKRTISAQGIRETSFSASSAQLARQRQADTLLHLSQDSSINKRVSIAKHNRQQSHHIIDIVIAIDICQYGTGS